MCINRLGPEKTGVLVLWEETLPVSCGPLGHLAEAGSHLWIELRDLCSNILGSSCRKSTEDWSWRHTAQEQSGTAGKHSSNHWPEKNPRLSLLIFEKSA